jgi:hypothetical protein
MTYSQNDDDLFEYDPEVDAEDSSAALQSEAYSPSSSNKNKTIEDFISSAKQLVDEISSDENSPIDEEKVKLAASFHTATSAYYQKVQTPSYIKAISITLNTLTNGDFAKIQMFNHKEALIIQRLRYLSMMNKVFINADADENVVKELFDLLKIEYSLEHVQTFYLSSANISMFCLNLDRAIYKHLGKQLNLPIKEHLLDDSHIQDGDKYFDQLNDPVDNDYISESYAFLFSAMANEGLLKDLSEIYNVPFDLVVNT